MFVSPCTCAQHHSIYSPPGILVWEPWSLEHETFVGSEPRWLQQTAAATHTSVQGRERKTSKKEFTKSLILDKKQEECVSYNNNNNTKLNLYCSLPFLISKCYKNKNKLKKCNEGAQWLLCKIKYSLPSPLSSCAEWRCGSLTIAVSCIVQKQP